MLKLNMLRSHNKLLEWYLEHKMFFSQTFRNCQMWIITVTDILPIVSCYSTALYPKWQWTAMRWWSSDWENTGLCCLQLLVRVYHWRPDDMRLFRWQCCPCLSKVEQWCLCSILTANSWMLAVKVAHQMSNAHCYWPEVELKQYYKCFGSTK